MRKIYTLLFCAMIFANTAAHAVSDTSYSYKNIPVDLLPNADMVVRNHHTKIVIKSLTDISVTRYYAITIMNEKAYDASKLTLFYNQFIKVKSMAGRVYDKNGGEVRKLKLGDVHDFPIISGSTFMDDSRYKFFDFGYASYPFTVEYEIEEKYNTSLFLPAWEPQETYKCSVESSDIIIDFPQDMPLRYKVIHTSEKPKESVVDGAKQLSFSLANIPAMKLPTSVSLEENFDFPTMLLAVDKFTLQDKAGDLDSWTSLGKFFYELNAGRDILPENIKRDVHQITDTCKSTMVKIGLLYDYLKKNTHYVSIQLGIGGWQTFDANFVGEKGYGDCKALSNYMKSLLKEAGVPAYQALVKAGEEDHEKMDIDFPHNQFNHVILCVPNQKDTVWLECTAKTLPEGYLSDFTSDRNVLMLTPEGGHVIKTPVYTEQDNVLSRSAFVHIDSNDMLKGDVSFIYNGFFYDHEKGRINNASKEKIENYFNTKFSLPNNTIKNYSQDEGRQKYIPFLHESISLEGAPNITHAGARLFVEPDIIKMNVEALTEEERTTPFELHKSYRINDTVSLSLDGDYTAETLPAEVDMSYPFASFHYKVIYEGRTIKMIRSYEQKKGIYPAAAFHNYLAINKAVGTSQKKVVLVKHS